MSDTTAIADVLATALAAAEAQWSVGSFGAIAEFSRDADEPAVLARGTTEMSVVTGRGAMRIAVPDGAHLFAFETATKEAWSQRVAICLPEAAGAMSRRSVVTELGPDRAALNDEERDAILFDLGLGTFQVDACVRTREAALIAALRAGAGKPLSAPGNPAMGAILAASPHRVFLGRCGRIEVFQPIPATGGVSPDGPHTHVLPKLLAHRRTHAATEPIPEGLVPCAYFYPPHPLRDGLGRARPFDAMRHAAFQRLLSRFGDRASLAVKAHILSAVAAGQGPFAVPSGGDRFARAAIRIALRQFRTSGLTSPSLPAWTSVYETGGRGEVEADDHLGPHGEARVQQGLSSHARPS